MMRYPWGRLVRFGFELLTGKGVAEEHARYLSVIRETEATALVDGRSGFSEIRLPGERSLRLLRESKEACIPLHEEMIESLNRTARRNGIAAL